MSNQWGTSEQDSWGYEVLESQPDAPIAPARKRGGVTIASIVIALVVIAAAAGLYFAYGRSTDQASEAQVAPDATESQESGESTTDSASESESASAQENGQEPSTVVSTVVNQPDKGSCDPEAAVNGDFAKVSLFCNGQWSLVGQASSSLMNLYYWTGSQWAEYKSDVNGKPNFPEYKCYDEEKLAQAEAPADLISFMRPKGMICGESPATTTTTVNDSLPPGGDFLPYVDCSGEYVVIVDSVIVYPGENPKPPVLQSIDNHPGSQATYPGVCKSFRSSYDGALVYPVFIDYGSDRAGACAAESRGEGFARELRQVEDYSSPC